MFDITINKGFQMQFANGWTVSVQWGRDNYCENRHMKEELNTYKVAQELAKSATFGQQGLFPPVPTCPDAEIAAWNADDQWYEFECDTVKGWCSPDEVAEFIAMVASFPMSLPEKSEEK